MKRVFSFFTGALIGGLVGAIAALLFAPMKGTILRAKLHDYALEISDEVKQAAQVKKEELESKLISLRK